jgi:hypothetical protein
MERATGSNRACPERRNSDPLSFNQVVPFYLAVTGPFLLDRSQGPIASTEEGHEHENQYYEEACHEEESFGEGFAVLDNHWITPPL